VSPVAKESSVIATTSIELQKYPGRPVETVRSNGHTLQRCVERKYFENRNIATEKSRHHPERASPRGRLGNLCREIVQKLLDRYLKTNKKRNGLILVVFCKINPRHVGNPGDVRRNSGVDRVVEADPTNR
jgi:hypothetical protein